MPRRNKRAQEYIPPLDLSLINITWQLLEQAQTAAEAQRAAVEPYVEQSTKEARRA